MHCIALFYAAIFLCCIRLTHSNPCSHASNDIFRGFLLQEDQNFQEGQSVRLCPYHLLYDSGQYKLARRRKLDFAEIRERAQKYFDDKFGRALSFLIDVGHAANRGDYKQASFYLHQSAENLLRTVSLVHILYSPKNHDLDELLRSCKAYTIELCRAFPRNTPEEERLFDLLQRSYIESRYNPDFEITKTDIEALVPKVERLRDIVEKICREQIAFYGYQIKE